MRRSSSQVLRNVLAIFFGVALVGVIALNAQVDTGSIAGVVTDASGAVVSGAKVTLTNEGTGAALTTTTSSDGVYKFAPVRVATYKLEVGAQGFQTTTQAGVKVDVGSNVGLNFTLKPGSQTETVEVTGAAPVLQTQDASVGQIVSERAVNDLPLNGRNFTFLAQLTAGVNSPQADTRGNAASGAFTANGFRPAQNNYMLDGIDNNSDTVDFLNGTNYVILPPVDAVQEFKVQTTDFSAEYGRSGAAVLNATIKSGTNQFHGDVWEFLRNDKFDSRDWFNHQNTNGVWGPGPKAELRQNDYGFTIGGPVVIPHVFDGRNKVFFFGDYNGFKRRQGIPHGGSVPTLTERNQLTAYQGGASTVNFQDMITGQSGTQTDNLGRTLPLGTILDPATTRNTGSGPVRDPFTTTCANAPANFVYTLAACPDLNIIPSNRIDPNAAALLLLYPNPTNNGAFLDNFHNSPNLKEDRQSFDTRLDVNFSQKDQLFYRFSLADDPQFIPAIFGGVADGGAFFEGNQTALAQQSALVWTHTFTPTTVNVARGGLNYLHTTRTGPVDNQFGIPAQYGIQGVPQVHENGGLPAFGINGLATLGSNAFLPSDEVSSTIQFNDDLTKIYGKHTFKAGFEMQHVKFSTLQPPWSHGEFDFNGAYTDVVAKNNGNTGRADFLLTPALSTVGGTNYVGGPSTVQLSNIYESDNGKNYYGFYGQDDWRVSSKLTVNLGLRWDFFGLVYDHHGGQANFVPSGAPIGSPIYILPVSSATQFLSGGASANACAANPLSFLCLAFTDGINVAVTNKYGKGLGNSQKTNFAPRIGFAYQLSPKLVARGGFGIFYNGFENRGYYPNLGENYPFQFNFSFNSPNDTAPNMITGCSTTPGPNGATFPGNATLETGFSCTPLDPTSSLFSAKGLALRGIQFNYQTPYSEGANLSLQYQLTPTTAFQAGYVYTGGRHLEVFPNDNTVTQLLPAKDNTGTGLNQQNFVQFPDFGYGMPLARTIGSSYYHGLQTKFEKQFSQGLNFLFTYTYSKVRSDSVDLLNGFGQNYRAANIPGFGIHHDYGLANFDVRNVFHFSGGYDLPFGKGKRLMGDAHGASQAVVGGWKIIWAATVQGGQPFLIGCNSGTATGVGCNAWVIPGRNPILSPMKIDPNNGNPIYLNASAFTQACQMQATTANPLGPVAPILNSPTGCSPVTNMFDLLGGQQPSQVEGPKYRRLDLSLFKNFQFTERTRLEFRSEFFNILNHPNFNAPGFGGNGVVAVSGSTNFVSPATFGEIGATRDGAYSSREIQFALKLYF